MHRHSTRILMATVAMSAALTGCGDSADTGTNGVGAGKTRTAVRPPGTAANKVRLIAGSPLLALDLVIQNPDESDEDFARRVTPLPTNDGFPQLGPGEVVVPNSQPSIDLMRTDREMIDNENLTQKAYELRKLTGYKATADDDVRRHAAQVAEWESDLRQNPDLVAIKAMLPGRRGQLESAQQAQRFIDAKIAEVRARPGN